MCWLHQQDLGTNSGFYYVPYAGQAIWHPGNNVTNESIGANTCMRYAIYDFEKRIDKRMLFKLKNIPGTINLRLLDFWEKTLCVCLDVFSKKNLWNQVVYNEEYNSVNSISFAVCLGLSIKLGS